MFASDSRFQSAGATLKRAAPGVHARGSGRLIQLRPLAEVEPAAVEALLDRAFGIDRKARTAYRLREGAEAVPALSFAAFDGDRLVGTLQSWPVALIGEGGAAEPLVMVGPVAVEPDVQTQGIGKALMEALLDAADAGGADALMMIGDPDYYGRFFGFRAAGTGGWQLPGPVERHRLLARTSGGRRLPAHGTLVARSHC